MIHETTLLPIEEATVKNEDGVRLSELLRLTGHGSCGNSDTAALHDTSVRRVIHDSRCAGNGDLFVALESASGPSAESERACLEHARQAVAAGAVAIASSLAPRDLGVPWVRVSDARRSLAELAAQLEGHPSRGLDLVGVTGTNGKTSVAHAVARILEAGCSRETGVMGTIHAAWGGAIRPASRTTPEATELQATLAEMLADGCDAVALEVSSHGLDLHRVHALRFAAVGMTNLSRDHLDWHGDMASYYAAKSRLFKECAPDAPAVLCIDDAAGLRLAAELRAANPGRTVLTVGSAAKADLRITSFEAQATGCSFRLRGDERSDLVNGVDVDVRAPWVGRHNAENLAVAAGLVLCLGIRPEELEKGLSSLESVPGRLVPVVVDEDRDVRVFVDYAHTPSALARVLEALRELTQGRLWCVFGCGGDRDQGKRGEMGAVVGQAADVAVATSDNPRSEDPDAILRMVVAGMGNTEARLVVESDRRRAIELCLAECKSGDVVVVAGKGHETYQEIGGQRFPFDDAEVVRAVWEGLHPLEGQDSQ